MDKNTLPNFLKNYFWDSDFSQLNLFNHKQFIIKRVIDRGNSQAISWLTDTVSPEEIKDVVVKTRDLSPQTANFWADFWNIDHHQVKCLQKLYSPTPYGLSS